MFQTLFADTRGYLDLVNAVATGLTRFARVSLRTNALTPREKAAVCYQLLALYRAVVWKRVIDDTDQAGEIAILLCCVTPDCGSEWPVARRLQRAYIFN